MLVKRVIDFIRNGDHLLDHFLKVGSVGIGYCALAVLANEVPAVGEVLEKIQYPSHASPGF
jgi:hypothetical protein